MNKFWTLTYTKYIQKIYVKISNYMKYKPFRGHEKKPSNKITPSVKKKIFFSYKMIIKAAT